MKKVALIYSDNTFTKHQVKKYFNNFQKLNSENVCEIYNFILKQNCINSITKFILHINSGVLDKLIDLIYCKKKSNNIYNLFNKFTFVATLSNANSVRDKNKEKETNIYFSLSPLSIILNSFKDIPNSVILFIISNNEDNPYYNQIEDIIKKDNVKRVIDIENYEF